MNKIPDLNLKRFGCLDHPFILVLTSVFALCLVYEMFDGNLFVFMYPVCLCLCAYVSLLHNAEKLHYIKTSNQCIYFLHRKFAETNSYNVFRNILHQYKNCQIYVLNIIMHMNAAVRRFRVCILLH